MEDIFDDGADDLQISSNEYDRQIESIKKVMICLSGKKTTNSKPSLRVQWWKALKKESVRRSRKVSIKDTN